MSTWNMPPGVNTNMIPGNRPEDLAEEAFYDALYEKLTEDQQRFLDMHDDTLAPIINAVRDLAMTEGYNQAKQDADIDRMLAQEGGSQHEVQ